MAWKYVAEKYAWKWAETARKDASVAEIGEIAGIVEIVEIAGETEAEEAVAEEEGVFRATEGKIRGGERESRKDINGHWSVTTKSTDGWKLGRLFFVQVLESNIIYSAIS